MDILFFGTPVFSAYILEELFKSGKFNIKAVVTAPDKPVGRKQELTPSAVSQTAAKHNIKVFKPQKLSSDFVENLKEEAAPADFLVVVAYGKIIPQSILDLPKIAPVNIHGSVLPKHRGASPIHAAILAGDDEAGISIMKMDEQMDHGPVYVSKSIKLLQKDTYETLSTKLMRLSSELLIESLPKIAGGSLTAKEQDHTKASYCKLIDKKDGFFDIENPPAPQLLDRMIRAYYPWPNVWTVWKGKTVKFLPGKRLQMEGKKPSGLKDFLNGYPDFPGQVVRALDPASK